MRGKATPRGVLPGVLTGASPGRTPPAVRRSRADAPPGRTTREGRTRAASGHDHAADPSTAPPADPDDRRPAAPGRLLRVISSAPKRTLLAVFLFVLVAGFFGGPVAGSLESAGGFATSDADSVRAIERIEAATGRAPSAGIVAARRHPGRAARRRRPGRRGDRRRSRPSPASSTSPRRPRTRGDPAGLVSTDGTQVLVLGTLARRRGRRPRRRVGPRHLRRPGRRHRRRLGRGRPPARQHRRRGPRPRRAVGLPDPVAAVAALLPRPRRADAAGRRGHHGPRHLPGPHRRQRSSTA